MRKTVSTALSGVAAAALLLTSACSGDTVEQPSPEQAVQIIDAGEHAVIDVRTPAEYAAGHVAGARNIDATARTFEQEVRGLEKDGQYLVYCQSGNRSAVAAEKMADLGFTQVVDGGGILSLEAAGVEVVVGG